MRLSVSLTVQQEALLKERAVAAGLSMAEWVRQAIDSYSDADVNHRSAGSESLCDAQIAALTSAQATAIAERDRAVAQVEGLLERSRTLEGEVRAAELKAALTEKDLELSDAKMQSLQEVRQGLEARVIDLRATAGMLEGQVATLMTAQNRVLSEAQKPWWKRIFG
jgi:chromosome segregation ATPase